MTEGRNEVMGKTKEGRMEVVEGWKWWKDGSDGNKYGYFDVWIEVLYY